MRIETGEEDMSVRSLLIVAAALAALHAVAVNAQDVKRLTVNQDDPALEKFRASPPRAARGRSKAEQSNLKELQGREIPVLNFTTPPLAKASKGRSAVRCKQDVVTDDDPGWYSVRHDCQGTIITVTGDRRVQTELQAAAPRAATNPGGLVVRPATGDLGDSGGLTAEMVLTRYPNIPYSITVTCTPANIATCKSESELRKIADGLGLVAVPPKN
jgi:hypothetical protein